MAAGTPSLWFEKSARSGARRMGGLAALMTAVARAWSREFTRLASTPGEIAFKTTRTPAADAVLASGSAPIFGLLRTSWDVPVAIRFEKAFVVAAVEALFGSSGEEDLVEVAPGPLSRIEAGVADVVGQQVAAALTEGFAEINGATFAFEAIVPKLDPAVLGKPQGSVLTATFSLAALGGTVELDVLFSQAALDLVGKDLADASGLPRSSDDPFWSERLGAEVGRATVTLKALLDTVAMTLGEIADLRPGQVLPLPSGARDKVRLACEERDLFRCELGQSAGLYTVRIDAPVAAK